MSLGPKLMDGLRVFADRDRWPRGGFADAALVELGYPERVAASIIERLHRKGLVESGVTGRSGWLTENGRRALNGLSPIRELDQIDDAIAKVTG